MPFTTTQLAAQLDNTDLKTWADSTLQDQAQYIDAFTAYFHGIQAWIDGHGGDGQPFGFDNVVGLTYTDGTQVVLRGPADTGPFNDAFNDVRKYLGQPTFRLFQAAGAAVRLIGVLNRMRPPSPTSSSSSGSGG